MNEIEALSRAAQVFDQRLSAVTADQWDGPTPCSEWTVRDLADHVIGGNRYAVRLLAGDTSEQAFAAMRAAGFRGEPLAMFRESAEAQTRAFAAPSAMDAVCHHVAGDMPGSQFVRLRVGDQLVHSWDLAKATGADDALDEELVRFVVASLEPLAPVLGSTGMFGSGPTGTPESAGSPQERLLDLVGRQGG